VPAAPGGPRGAAPGMCGRVRWAAVGVGGKTGWHLLGGGTDRSDPGAGGPSVKLQARPPAPLVPAAYGKPPPLLSPRCRGARSSATHLPRELLVRHQSEEARYEPVCGGLEAVDAVLRRRKARHDVQGHLLDLGGSTGCGMSGGGGSGAGGAGRAPAAAGGRAGRAAAAAATAAAAAAAGCSDAGRTGYGVFQCPPSHVLAGGIAQKADQLEHLLCVCHPDVCAGVSPRV
jgi:hypothetical protein